MERGVSKPLDRQAIAEAMEAAGRKALTGTREERSGVFQPAAPKAAQRAEPSRTPQHAPKLAR